MSWSILLATYPRSIFQSGELPLVILALIERSGLITEDSVIAEAGKPPEEIKAVLFDLSLNLLIEYGSHHIRLTERGKQILSRFDLDEMITNSMLDFLHFEQREREPFRLALGAYRRNAYKFYVNSLCSAWTWKDLAGKALRQESLPPSEEILAGMRVLLVGDISQWWRQIEIGRNESHFSPQVQEGCAHLSDTLKEWETSDDLTRRYVQLFGRLGSRRLKIGGEVKQHEEDPLHLVFFSFGNFRAKSEPYRWFDHWLDIKTGIPSPKRYQRPRTYAMRVCEFLSMQSEPEGEPRGASYHIEAMPIPARPIHETGGLLDQVLIAKSLKDLSGATGISPEALVNLLGEVAKKCLSLIDDNAAGKLDT